MSIKLMPDRPRTAAIRYFGDYILLGEMARGGMGVVYQALQANLDREVAIKMIDAGRLASESAIHRFQTEAEAMAQLDHPNIVSIYEVGEHEGHHYFAMKLVDGPNLAEHIGNRPMKPKQAAELMITVARAVQYAHDHGVLHRDLKPSNILVDSEGQPHVTDFGIAKLAERAEGVTASLAVLGTPEYMAPEQAAGKTRYVTTAADTYSLGAVLYQLLTGGPPFRGESPTEILMQVQEREPVSPRSICPAIPADLETICLKCLEKDPQHRYTRVDGLADDLNRWLRHEPIVARPGGNWSRAAKWVRRHPAITVMLALLVIVASAGAGGILWQWNQAVAARKQTEDQLSETRRANIVLRLQRAEDLFSRRRPDLALAGIARLTRDEPHSRAPQERLINALNQHAFLIPTALPTDTVIIEPLKVGINGGRRAEVTDATNIAVVALDGSFQVSLSGAHQTVIRSIRFSPDGQRLVSASSDATAKVWDIDRGKLLHTFQHTNEVNYAEYSPDGLWIVTASSDRTARVWSSITWTEAQPAVQHEDSVNFARFNPESSKLITASDDRTVRLWSFEAGFLGVAARFLRPVRQAVFSDDGQQVIVTFDSMDGSGSQVLIIKRNEAIQPAAPFEPGSDFLERSVRQHAGQVNPLDDWKRRNPTGLMDRSIRGLHADVSEDTSVRISRTNAPNQPLVPLLVHHTTVNCVRFSPDGLRLVTSTAEPTRVRVWDVDTGQPLTDWFHSAEPVHAVKFSEDGRWILASGALSAWQWQIHAAQNPSPRWLADLAAFAAGEAWNTDYGRTRLSWDDRMKLKSSVLTQAAGHTLEQWARNWISNASAKFKP